MSWNGSIPRKVKKAPGLRNKRNQSSPKALIAKKVRQEKRAAMNDRMGNHHESDY